MDAPIIKKTLYSPAAVAAMHGVHVQTALNAVDDGTLKAECFVMGPKGSLVATGITADAARCWHPRKRGRPRRVLEPQAS